MNRRRALHTLAVAALDEVRDIRDPDPIAGELNRAARLAANTLEQFWIAPLSETSGPLRSELDVGRRNVVNLHAAKQPTEPDRGWH